MINRLSASQRSIELILTAFVALFLCLNSAALAIAGSVASRAQLAFVPLVWLAVIGLLLWLLHRFRPKHDPYIVPIFALLTGWGLLLQNRLAPNFTNRQLMWFALGAAILVSLAILPPNLRFLRRYRYSILIFGIVLLLITLFFGVNPAGFAATYWLPVPLLNAYFQPSELLKLLMVFFFASYFADRGRLIAANQQQVRELLPYLAPLLLMWGFCLILLVWQRDLGAAAIFFVLFLAMLYVATGSRRYVLLGALLLLIAGLLGYRLYDVITLRVDAWLNPWPDFDNRAYQIVQSLYALAAGGISGQGIAQGFPDIVPVVHSDFVFAAIGEEWGMIGTLTVVLCFAVLAQRGMRIALLANSAFRMYLAVGMTMLLSMQSILIMGGVTKLLPLTGVTLPFVSYGGSSLLMASCMLGLLLWLDSAEEGKGRGRNGE
ncbi:MAG: FtsW/RodA/SpoVE family cell cycle protein [Candidatus Promineifilaceae bacterium]